MSKFHTKQHAGIKLTKTHQSAVIHLISIRKGSKKADAYLIRFAPPDGFSIYQLFKLPLLLHSLQCTPPKKDLLCFSKIAKI